ncbi:hypothetical protein PROAA_740006 [Candidatus Propionivibrio aalborgensis]|uniref:Uncharacterized protein n=1 Tax=Candidatus Propionivibrio aalborgensis TaxID=1860101 RepID=A0A1A8Y135_9RHOO|nr:hypothetical protein PROAA_740006 [Candidatus Propionivibrio aalborgensis]
MMNFDMYYSSSGWMERASEAMLTVKYFSDVTVSKSAWKSEADFRNVAPNRSSKPVPLRRLRVPRGKKCGVSREVILRFDAYVS